MAFSATSSAEAAGFAAQYQGSPIVLSAGTGIAQNGDIPFTQYTDNPRRATPFAEYVVLPGGSLIDNEITRLPFANQAVAANGIIQKPLRVSMLMICPATTTFADKTQAANALVTALQQHCNLGGLFDVATIMQTYLKMVLLMVRDVSDATTQQVQFKYQLDFEQPLVTLDQEQQVLNTLLQKLTDGSAPNPVAPDIVSASNYASASVTDMTAALNSSVSPALTAAGIDATDLPGVLASAVPTAIAANFSPTDLANHIANEFIPVTNSIGMPFSAAQQIFQSSVMQGLGQLGITPAVMQNLLKASIGSLSIPGVSALLSSGPPATEVFI